MRVSDIFVSFQTEKDVVFLLEMALELEREDRSNPIRGFMLAKRYNFNRRSLVLSLTTGLVEGISMSGFQYLGTYVKMLKEISATSGCTSKLLMDVKSSTRKAKPSGSRANSKKGFFSQHIPL